MQYLSKEIAQLAKKNPDRSLIAPQNSCGIFQDYGPHDPDSSEKK
ncbi:hypothetical protein WIW50_11155 [Flavobacteriaceae bacterium 3-367]